MFASSSVPPSPVAIHHAQMVNRFNRLRDVSRRLNNQVLLPRIPGDAIQEAGRALGILRRGVLVFDTEDET